MDRDTSVKAEFSSAERDTVLAALRVYQGAGYCDPECRPPLISAIATNEGENPTALNEAQIDALCERLNCTRKALPDDSTECRRCEHCGSANIQQRWNVSQWEHVHLAEIEDDCDGADATGDYWCLDCQSQISTMHGRKDNSEASELKSTSDLG